MDLQVVIPVGTSVPYRVGNLHLIGEPQLVEVNFEPGNHVWTSSDFVLGTVHTDKKRTIIGRLSLRYTYDDARQVVTLCGTDFPSADGMKLITSPEGHDDVCIEHASGSGFVGDEMRSNRIWNYRTRLTPGAAEIFRGIVRSANEALIRALRARDDHFVLTRDLFPDIPTDAYLRLCTVHRQGKFLELFDPNKEYDADAVIGIPESSLGGTMTVPAGGQFANVLGSTGDPYPAGYNTWIAVWEGQYHVTPNQCSSLNSFVPARPPGTLCNNIIVGGHCIKGNTAQAVAYGANDVVFIIPICSVHNNVAYTGAMTPQNGQNQGVWLTNYHQ